MEKLKFFIKISKNNYTFVGYMAELYNSLIPNVSNVQTQRNP